MARYEKANEKSGRLFITSQEKLAQNPKLPALNGSIMIDGVLLYLSLWRRQAKSGAEYFTAEMTYPADEEARLKATAPATSEAAAKERAYDQANPQVKEDQKRRWDARSGNQSVPTSKAVEKATADDELPF